MDESNGIPMKRREFLRAGVAAVTLGSPAVSILSSTRCVHERDTEADEQDQDADSATVRKQPVGRVREVRLVADVGDVDVGLGRVYRTWLYNGRFPGQEIRVREGERLRVVLENRLPDATTVHWHGVPLPNAMDGVPDVTQEAVAPGDTFIYEYVAEPAGTYMYHSHAALQLDRGLLGPLIIEERSSAVDYDREYTVVLDDLLIHAPRRVRGGRMSMMMGMGASGPEYDGFLINGRPSEDPAVLDVRRGERIRLRLINPSGQTTFRIATTGHTMTVTHADGRPIRPVDVDALIIGMGERYDVLIDAGNPGAWNLMASSIEGQRGSARAVLRYQGAVAAAPPEAQVPEGLRAGRLLTLEDLDGGEPEAGEPRRPDRTFDLTLSSRMMSDAWLIEGQAYPDAEPLEIREGERVRVRMTQPEHDETSDAPARPLLPRGPRPQRHRDRAAAYGPARARVHGRQPRRMAVPLPQPLPHGGRHGARVPLRTMKARPR